MISLQFAVNIGKVFNFWIGIVLDVQTVESSQRPPCCDSIVFRIMSLKFAYPISPVLTLLIMMGFIVINWLMFSQEIS